MTVDYIKQEISTEICEDGGASARLVNNKVLPLGTAVEEAINGHYVVGEKSLITSEVAGVITSMINGTSKDGNARQLDDLFTVYPQYYGLIDPEKGHDPSKNGVEAKIRLLKELKLDTSNWTFNDVTPGKLPIKVYNASTGDKAGVVENGKQVKFVGYGLDSTTRVEWYVEGTAKAGTIPETSLGRSATVLTAPALSGLDASCDGKTVKFTVYGAKNCANASATVTYVAPPVVAPTMTEVHPIDHPAETNKIRCFEEANILTGTGLNGVTAVKYAWEQNPGEILTGTGEITEKTATTLKFTMEEVQFNAAGHLIVTWSGGDVTSTFTVEAKEPEE